MITIFTDKTYFKFVGDENAETYNWVADRTKKMISQDDFNEYTGCVNMLEVTGEEIIWVMEAMTNVPLESFVQGDFRYILNRQVWRGELAEAIFSALGRNLAIMSLFKSYAQEGHMFAPEVVTRLPFVKPVFKDY